MFTGIVTETGTVVEIELTGEGRVRIGAERASSQLEVGASVACDGVCLTAVKVDGADSRWFEVDVSSETLSRTAIGGWSAGSSVNLERSLRVGDELGGHIVSGHVDGVARVARRIEVGESVCLTVETPEELAPFIAPKGSVALNGVSLTVNEVTVDRFSVNLIPHTMAATNLGSVDAGDPLNLEIDMIARYVERLVHLRS